MSETLAPADLNRLLKDHIDAVCEKSVVWDVDDCTAWPAAWLEKLTGRVVRRPHWATKEEAHGLISRAGSLDRLWADVLCEYGLRETGRPQAGDVGVIETGKYGQIGAIFVHGGFAACRAETGIAMILPRRFMRVWSVQEWLCDE